MLGAAGRLPIPPEFRDIQPLGDRQQPVLVVRMTVRQHHPVELCDAARLQPRQHGQLADAPAVPNFSAAVNERSRAVVAFQQRRVAVADVQPGQPQ